MRAIIQKLLEISNEKIQSLSLDEAHVCIENFKIITDCANHIWKMFKEFDTDKRDTRTLELIQNHANGAIVQKYEEMNTIRSSMKGKFFSPVDLEIQKNLQNMASAYLYYQSQKNLLASKEILIQARINRFTVDESTRIYSI